MGNKIILVVIVLVIFSAGVYLAVNSYQRFENNVNELINNLTAKLQAINLRVPPYVSTGNPVGYLIEFENGAKFYFAGDTGLISDMKDVIGDYYKPDVAFLPIGDQYVMGPKMAAYAASLINPSKYVAPVHYASFPFQTQTPDEFFKELGKYNLRASALKFDEGQYKDVMGVKVLWLGHGSWFFVSPQDTRILIDPQVSANPYYPIEYKDFKKLERVDIILLTHGHMDHTSLPDLQTLANLYKPLIIAPYELATWLAPQVATTVVSENIGAELTKDDLKTFGVEIEKMDGITINLTNTAHSSSATPPSK